MTKYFNDVFNRDKKRCVYCGKDLMSSFDDFFITQEDHLVPKKLNGPNNINNIVTSCYVCNKLKGDYFPDNFSVKDIEDEKQRRQLIDIIREQIFKIRSQNMNLFLDWTK